MVSPGRISVRGLLAFLAVPAFLAGCRDAPTDPMVGLVAEEAYAALALGVSFPDPATWVTDDELTTSGARALESWRASWDLPAEEGHELREEAYDALAADLEPVVTPERLQEELARLNEAVLRARGLGLEEIPEHVAQGIDRAEAQNLAARAAFDEGDVTHALGALVRGADALREVGPEAVARALQGEVEERLRRISEADSYTDQDMERLQRLMRGGRQALDEGSWGLAIRRAFYAKGLLDANG